MHSGLNFITDTTLVDKPDHHARSWAKHRAQTIGPILNRTHDSKKKLHLYCCSESKL
jgi:hypothetical protein